MKDFIYPERWFIFLILYELLIRTTNKSVFKRNTLNIKDASVENFIYLFVHIIIFNCKDSKHWLLNYLLFRIYMFSKIYYFESWYIFQHLLFLFFTKYLIYFDKKKKKIFTESLTYLHRTIDFLLLNNILKRY